MKKVLLLVPDGVGIKNYLYSKTFDHPGISVTLFHNFDSDTLQQIKEHVAIDQEVTIPDYKESIPEKLLREAIHYARLKLHTKRTGNEAIMKFWKKGSGGITRQLFYKAVLFYASLLKSYKSILRAENRYQRLLQKNQAFRKLQAIFEELSPDELFCTHQRAIKAPIVFSAARSLGIKSTTVIYSWDNIPKARLALRADRYLVWSQHMKEEMEVYYPEISEEKIIITGTPQFEFYEDENNIVDREEFFALYGLDPNKKLICFSGDDVRTSPHDPSYLSDVAEAMKKAGMEHQFQLVFRRCPVDVSGRYQRVIEEHSDMIVEIPPLWNFNKEIWSAVYPTFQDVKRLVSLARHAEVVINVGSTMAFDFGMYNKPCIFINYDQESEEDWSVKTIYNYPHFKSMPAKNVVYWFEDKQKISEVLQEALAHPKTEIKQWEKVIRAVDKKASEEIQKILTA